jgi:hypothetical protein
VPGFVTWGDRLFGEAAALARQLMDGYAGWWAIAGGWAVDLFCRRRTRPHADLEICVLYADQEALNVQLAGWDARVLVGQGGLERWRGQPIAPPHHQLWARRGTAPAEDWRHFVCDPSMIGFLFAPSNGGRWLFRRDDRVQRTLGDVAARGAGGAPFVRPEVELLFKSKSPRRKDERDLDAALPLMDAAAREWLWP